MKRFLELNHAYKKTRGSVYDISLILRCAFKNFYISKLWMHFAISGILQLIGLSLVLFPVFSLFLSLFFVVYNKVSLNRFNDILYRHILNLSFSVFISYHNSTLERTC